jgi:hypothetical protein
MPFVADPQWFLQLTLPRQEYNETPHQLFGLLE